MEGLAGFLVTKGLCASRGGLLQWGQLEPRESQDGCYVNDQEVCERNATLFSEGSSNAMGSGGLNSAGRMGKPVFLPEPGVLHWGLDGGRGRPTGNGWASDGPY